MTRAPNSENQITSYSRPLRQATGAHWGSTHQLRRMKQRSETNQQSRSFQTQSKTQLTKNINTSLNQPLRQKQLMPMGRILHRPCHIKQLEQANQRTKPESSNTERNTINQKQHYLLKLNNSGKTIGAQLRHNSQ